MNMLRQDHEHDHHSGAGSSWLLLGMNKKMIRKDYENDHHSAAGSSWLLLGKKKKMIRKDHENDQAHLCYVFFSMLPVKNF